eukprot:TRINITY_DN5475_c0_g1_i2.p3 TRINITY_DN5475_c0_g1~~TRINITY_DN5475_c0_g1_i2.p3  ORF type:complete len:244 (-),score=132.86 TRINITY_DN5475_c0_g1_i2:1919-2650(-)
MMQTFAINSLKSISGIKCLKLTKTIQSKGCTFQRSCLSSPLGFVTNNPSSFTSVLMEKITLDNQRFISNSKLNTKREENEEGEEEEEEDRKRGGKEGNANDKSLDPLIINEEMKKKVRTPEQKKEERLIREEKKKQVRAEQIKKQAARMESKKPKKDGVKKEKLEIDDFGSDSGFDLKDVIEDEEFIGKPVELVEKKEKNDKRNEKNEKVELVEKKDKKEKKGGKNRDRERKPSSTNIEDEFI